MYGNVFRPKPSPLRHNTRSCSKSIGRKRRNKTSKTSSRTTLSRRAFVSLNRFMAESRNKSDRSKIFLNVAAQGEFWEPENTSSVDCPISQSSTLMPIRFRFWASFIRPENIHQTQKPSPPLQHGPRGMRCGKPCNTWHIAARATAGRIGPSRPSWPPELQ